MNEVGGSESGTGLRAIKSSRSSDANFEYDDSEWDVGIGNLIIDLDADIEKNNEANRNNNNSDISGLTTGTGAISGTPSSSSNSSNLSANSSSSPTTTGSSNPQMHIPLTSSSGSNSNISGSGNSGSGNSKGSKSSGGSGNSSSSLSKGSNTNSSSSSDLSSVMEHSSVVDKGLKMKIKRTKTGTKSGADAKHEIVKNDVVGSSNGTSGGGSAGGNSGYSSNKSISDSISSKNSHSSHKDKDKLLIKDGLLHDNSHDSSSINNATSGNSKQDNSAEHGGKVKTPRKGSTKEKKVKNNSNVGNTGNSKKDDKNNDSGSKSLSNSSGGSGNSSSGSSGTHAKDNKEFFSTTVNLNVPNVIPNSSSSAFVKATATIKVPTAPSSSASSILSSSTGSGLHSSGGDSAAPSSANSRTQNLSTTNSSTSNSSTPWGTVSPGKGAEKGRLSPSVTNLTNSTEKTTGNSYNKKSRAFATSEKNFYQAENMGRGRGRTRGQVIRGKRGRPRKRPYEKDLSGSEISSSNVASQCAGPTADDNSTSLVGSNSGAAFRNQAALSINSATDLSTSSSNFIQGVPGTQSGSGFSSPKDSGKYARNNASSAPSTSTQDVCVGTSVGTVTEPDCLGPCEPGTSVTLEGIVWHETESGVLVVNVTWRGKTYVGTLIDCTKNDWAPPRFCDSPTSDLEMRTPKNRGKRGRAQTATPVNEPVVADTRSANAKLRNGAKGRRGSNTATAFVAPASPVKPDPWPKRKTRGSENESQEDPNPKNAKRPKVSKDGDRKDRRSNSPAPDNEKSGPSSPQLIECPEPNCSKKYKHINGLRYHQSHAHSNNFVATEDSDSNMSTASNTNTSAAPEPPNSTDSTVEPMVVDNGPEVPDTGAAVTTSNSSTATNSSADDSLSAPSTPGKKSGVISQSTPVPKVDDKVYDLSSDTDLNPIKDTNSQTPETPEAYSKSTKGAMASKPPSQGKDANVNSSEQESKLVPENLSKDSTTPPLSTTSASTPTTVTTTPTLTPRTPILTVPVVPYMSLQSRNMAHGHVVNVPRVESNLNSRENVENSPVKNSGIQGQTPVSKGAPWQPHAHSQSQSGLSGHGSHVMNTPPQSQSITVPLNIPMNIPGSGGKDKDKNASPEQIPLKKNKHKKKSKDKDKEREGKSKGDKDKQDSGMSKGSNVPMGSGPSDYSRSSGLFHNSSHTPDSVGGRSKDMSDSDSSRKNSLENRDDPQSPAYSDISDANDSGPDNELNVGSTIKDTSCKGLVIPGDIKKDPLSVPGVPGPPFQTFFNHHGLHSPYLDSLNYARQNKEGPVSADEPDKNRPGVPIKHPILPANSQAPPNPAVTTNDESRRSPKMDFHSKYPYPNPYFSYPYSGYHYDPPQFTNPMATENSFNPPGPNRMFPGMEERDKEGGPPGLTGKAGKPGEMKDDGPGNVQIKQEPVDRDEKRVKERPQSSALPLNVGEDKNVEIKSEFVSDHGDPKLMPSYMTNHSSKHHSSKDHKRNEDRHERRHESKDVDKSDSMKSGRNSSSNSDKNKSSEETEPKERKDEGAKPTMETTGPPPPPTASAYYLPHQSYLAGSPFGLPFDPSHPLYRQMLVPGPYPGSPYMHPGQIPRFPSPGGPTPLPEDLSRPNPAGPPGNSSKALDVLQHHAAQYYNSHKIHELQERALKSPSPQVAAAQRMEREGPPSSGPGGPPPSSSPGGHSLPGGVGHPVGGRSSVGGTSAGGSLSKPADLSKDSKPIIGPGGSIIPGGPNSDNVRTPPPTQHHVHSHTHHHTHVGIGYPILPTVPPQYSPHYGVLATPPPAPSVIPPFPSQKPS